MRLNGGMTLNQAYEAVAKQAAPLGVKSLQKGLNSFGDGSALKEDGIWGAKTTSRTKEALSRYGVDKVKQKYRVWRIIQCDGAKTSTAI